MDPHTDFAMSSGTDALKSLGSSRLKSALSYPAKYMVGKVKQMSLRKL